MKTSDWQQEPPPWKEVTYVAQVQYKRIYVKCKWISYEEVIKCNKIAIKSD